MRAVKYSHLAEQKDLHPRAFALIDLRTQSAEQRLDVPPLNEYPPSQTPGSFNLGAVRWEC